MTGDRAKTIKTMHDRYRYEYRRIYKKADRIAFFEEMGEIAAAAGALVWKTFADAMPTWLRKDLGVALEISEDAIALDPECAYSWNGKGDVLQSQKRYDEALAAHEKAIALVMSESQSLKDKLSRDHSPTRASAFNR
jgi:tetratricopeptide (TPR) repeat protein